ncbi:hypothetical protein QCB44_02580 [Thiomicrorhabdus sp. zzn3]|uniref:hypothetical protein n=1 Tax=Thiomicrorhabdus sp. zzn3 TaxID=3039775 RepID=UPI002436C04C|nr:hypothetical protein [Thiomicrorhabdus sp. zzn3]MDG6777584.1 hypothetical protein [Thiomicrorhabdus sp. zzn3]
MASADETFDPNDLDSIDALLDEAEQEVVESVAEPTPPAEEVVEDVPAASVEPEPEPPVELAEPQAEAEASAEPRVSQEKIAAVEEAVSPAEKRFSEADADDFVSKRAAAQKQSKNGLSAAEMDAIKKHITIFGSVLIVLVITAIGIGIWSALASSSGLDEETQSMIEDIKVGTERNTILANTGSEGLKELSKKLDALSFQLEQLTSDVVALEQKNGVAAPIVSGSLTGHGANNLSQDKTSEKVPPAHGTAMPAATLPVATPQAMNMATDPALKDKLNAVYAKVAKAQKRIDEVNRRVKEVQGQYGSLLRSVKVVEKQLIDQQVKKVKDEKKVEKPAGGDNMYQYSAPDGGFYDQANPDSYP